MEDEKAMGGGRNEGADHQTEKSNPHRGDQRPSWEEYIAAMRIMASISPDSHKIDAKMARQRAEERFFSDRHQDRGARRALLLQGMLRGHSL